MPLPTPSSEETKEVFMTRCLSDQTIKSDFPTQEQRVAVCINQWKGTKEEKEACKTTGKKKYKIREMIKFDKPIIKENKTEKTLQEKIGLKNWNIKKIKDEKLNEIHSNLHLEAFTESINTGKKPSQWYVDIHDYVLGEIKERKLNHQEITELDHFSKGNNKDNYAIKIMESLNNIVLRKPFLAMIKENYYDKATGKDKIKIWVNWASWDKKFLGELENQIKESLPENIREKIELIPDQEGSKVNMLPIADMSVNVNISDPVFYQLGEAKEARQV